MQALARRLATAPGEGWPLRPVRVALVITDLDIGGAERALVALATRLDRKRWEPSVIALGAEGALAEVLRASGIATRCLDAKRRRPVQAVMRLAAALRSIQPALVQSFLFHANVATKLAGPLAGAPWVLGGLRVAEREKRWHLTLDRLTSRLSAGSVCVSERVRQFSIEQGGLDPERLTVIANGVDLERFQNAAPADRAALGVPRDAHLALFVGRLHAQKGVDLLLEAAERVVSARADWHLAIAGSGPEGERLRAHVSKCEPLRDRVHWLGPRDDVPALLKTSDILVLPSRWEGMPNVVLEAMAAARAVVASNVEGVDELVIAGQTGWLVPPADVSALAQALLEAAADSSRTEHFGAAGRALVTERFAVARMVQAYESLWAGVLGLRV